MVNSLIVELLAEVIEAMFEKKDHRDLQDALVVAVVVVVVVVVVPQSFY